ncbi:MAG: hypothetical protein KDB92_06365, partial [Chitinophagaceae bacterium]|nr:hypothetical protein [Chitinophagaceae bacterium]
MSNEDVNINDNQFNSRLCFKPLVMMLKKNIAEGHAGLKKLYGQVVAQFESHPELLDTISDNKIVEQHSELIEELLSAVFPPTTANYMYGIMMPFKDEAVYVSPKFEETLIEPGTRNIIIPSNKKEDVYKIEKNHFAYGLILKKYL